MPDPTGANLDPKRINASPTKEFFIFMLTRDIPLSRAILDLVDNAVDGARSLRPASDFLGLWVRLELSRDGFKIVDNCGGIAVNIARDYAFRFGRPEYVPPTPGSVGQFGVGMKRTFFKLGRHFKVTSVTSSSRFVTDIDVDKWMAPSDKQSNQTETPDSWHFEFESVEENVQPPISEEEVGTTILIDNLYPAVADAFALENFVDRLRQEMTLAHSLSVQKGLAISVNSIPLQHSANTLFISDKIKPAYVEKVYERRVLDGKDGPPVKVKLLAGVAEKSLHEGGWYIFCNGRLVLRADQSSSTIWGPAYVGRNYHHSLASFRGYAFFDSDNPALLPWTTTKTGIDTDSVVYKQVQREMIEISKPVLTFLNNLENERASIEAGETSDRTLALAVADLKAQSTDTLAPSSRFIFPARPPVPPGPPMQKIQYSKPLEDVNKVMRLLKVRTYTAVGERTFEYYLKYEGEQ